MNKYYEILIDASLSMGFAKATEYENKFLLPDGSTRTSLVKNILSQSVIDKIDKNSYVNILTFSSFPKKTVNGEFIIQEKTKEDENGKLISQRSYVYQPSIKKIASTPFNPNEANKYLNKIADPVVGGTPLHWAIMHRLSRGLNDKILIILSDGDSTDVENFDEHIIEYLKKNKLNIKIYFIGIDQSKSASLKSENLSKFTGGKYVNIKAINYDKRLFEGFLFNFNSNLILDSVESSVASLRASLNNETHPTKESEKETGSATKHFKDEENKKVIKQKIDSITSQLKNLNDPKDILKEKDDFLECDEDIERNKSIGRFCEQELYDIFKSKGRLNLTWVNEKQEEFKHYDFVDNQEKTIYIECKGTLSDSMEFALTKEEWLFYLKHRFNYHLYFIQIFNNKKRIYRFNDLLNSLNTMELLPFSNSNRKVPSNRMWFEVKKSQHGFDIK